ncbi:pentatricopeptide repeat-containing protein At4g21190-like [Cynara cardunculus var. scolymus]|uniref:pentatricopeptide repeat-containing protein At4g21190-like n=1 Tax=Cynara cardunculus var. scolymus TaxID=59895 RepID=UPI000D62A5C2|nr:pentatricopeptide repeat-containing protein At4g21190-like [Cynara cardunculus var. scolymus]
MLRSNAIAGLIRPMRQLGIFRVPISNCSQLTVIQDHIPTPVDENYLQDHFNIGKDAEGIGKLQKTYNVSKKDKISVLVRSLLDLEDSKEAVYGALDAWVVGEREFPIGRLKTALIALEKMQEWHKVVQVIKWMLSKGQGVTVGTYGQLIRALDMDLRVEEANKLWAKKLGRDVQSVPWKVCDIMISVYYRNEMWEELVKLFKGLEAHGRKPPDQSIVKKVAESYEKLGLVEEKERFVEKYKSSFTKTRGKYGRKASKESSVTKISS